MLRNLPNTFYSVSARSNTVLKFLNLQTRSPHTDRLHGDYEYNRNYGGLSRFPELPIENFESP
jgi:hypothetical protein